MKIGIIGYGTIGRMLARAIEEGVTGNASLVAVMDIFEESPFSDREDAPLYTNDIDVFLSAGMDLVIEAASQPVLQKYGPLILQSGKHLMAMSLGAFADADFFEEMSRLALQHGCRVFLPSGAIGGLDALSAAALDEIDEVTLTTTKPPSGLRGADSSLSPEIDLDAITEPTCIYEGPAIEAVKRFPKNVNVAAALSLAGIGFEKTRVRVIADPVGERNVHRIEAKGRFGEFSLEFRLYPSPTNPKTSYLAPLSAIRTLKNITQSIKIGT